MSKKEKSKFELYAQRLKKRPLKLLETEQTKEFLIVRIKNYSYAIQLNEILKIIENTEYFYYPHFPEPVIGIIYDEGEVVNIFDLLHMIVGKKADGMYRHFVLIDEGIGFGIDSIEDMQTVTQSAKQDLIATSSAEEQEFTRGILSNKYPVLNIEKIKHMLQIKISGR